MHVSVTLRGRGRVAALLHRLEQKVGQRADGVRLDRRNQRTWRQLIVGVVVMRSTWLLALGRLMAPQRRAGSIKAAAQGLSYFLTEARAPLGSLSGQVLEEAVRQLDPDRVVRYTGKALVVLDPTAYEKRSRGRGKCGRHMHYIWRVRRSKATRPVKGAKGQASTPVPHRDGVPPPRAATAFGYVDIWAGLALRGKPFFPLARQLSSSQHPACTSQNAVEEAVLEQALGILRRVGLEAIVIGDRGVGRTEVIIRLARQEQGAVLRVDPDSTVYPADAPAGDGLLLADALAHQPGPGEVEWDRGQQGRLRCRLRTRRAAIQFSRSGRKDDVQEATVTFVEAVPLDGQTASLVLATTLRVETRGQARAVVRLYAQRWVIEAGFETMHAWGQDRFMVRSWTAIDLS